jgi:hypothetical protein
MAQTAILQRELKLDINDIRDVVVTPIEFDESTGLYVREFRFFGTTADPTATTMPQVLVVRSTAATRAALEVTTPALQV